MSSMVSSSRMVGGMAKRLTGQVGETLAQSLDCLVPSGGISQRQAPPPWLVSQILKPVGKAGGHQAESTRGRIRSACAADGYVVYPEGGGGIIWNETFEEHC